ncbi:MAG: hypothetical protein COC09_06145 [Gammaproteobacteria bacterium]|nr:VanZ family protein [Gammaproteobacteria bacterium]PCH63336.1 MAG: hypothetical protein COC09_06145 [Gammaproteobacteria bacterium]
MQALRVDRRFFAVGFLVWAAIIFWSASQPGSGQPQAFTGLDKIQHFIAYGMLAFLLAKAMTSHFSWKSMLVIVMAVVLLGVCDELYQATIANRTSSISDVVADGVGAVAGFLAAWRWQLYKNMKRKQ